jgi:hypothetical protein
MKGKQLVRLNMLESPKRLKKSHKKRSIFKSAVYILPLSLFSTFLVGAMTMNDQPAWKLNITVFVIITVLFTIMQYWDEGLPVPISTVCPVCKSEDTVRILSVPVHIIESHRQLGKPDIRCNSCGTEFKEGDFNDAVIVD